MTTTDIAITEALSVMEAHLAALNRQDAAALTATLHFPHYRLVGTELAMWVGPETYLDDFKTRAGSDWAYTKWRSLEVTQADATKVHLAVEIDRYDRKDKLIVAFKSTWVISKKDGRWAAQFRSSFAPT